MNNQIKIEITIKRKIEIRSVPPLLEHYRNLRVAIPVLSAHSPHRP